MLLRQLCLIGHMILLSGFNIEYILPLGFAASWLFNEPRPIVSIIKDYSITHQVSQKLSNDARFNQGTNITIVSFGQIVLLSGQVPNEVLKQETANYAFTIPKVRDVFNQITVSEPTGSWRRVQDALLTQVVRAKLLMTSNLRYHHFQITTNNGEVFILGKANLQEANLAASVAQKTAGVRLVTKLVEPD